MQKAFAVSGVLILALWNSSVISSGIADSPTYVLTIDSRSSADSPPGIPSWELVTDWGGVTNPAPSSSIEFRKETISGVEYGGPAITGTGTSRTGKVSYQVDAVSRRVGGDGKAIDLYLRSTIPGELRIAHAPGAIVVDQSNQKTLTPPYLLGGGHFHLAITLPGGEVKGRNARSRVASTVPESEPASMPAVLRAEYPVILGPLYLRVPLSGLKAAEVRGRDYPQLWLEYSRMQMMVGMPETHTGTEHLIRNRLPTVLRTAVSNEAEARRAVYMFKDGAVPGISVVMDPAAQSTMKQLQGLIAPRGIRESEICHGPGFVAVVSWYGRGAEIHGWSEDELVQFVVVLGRSAEQDEQQFAELVWSIGSTIILRKNTSTQPSPSPDAALNAVARQLLQRAKDQEP